MMGSGVRFFGVLGLVTRRSHHGFSMLRRSEIFIELAYREMNSFDKGLYYLSYEKIRAYAANNRGNFTKKQFYECIGLSPSKGLTHLARLVEKGMVVRIGDTQTFKIIKPRHVLGYYQKEHTAFIPHSLLFSFSWKNIASWRALLSEVIVQRNRFQRSAIKNTRNRKVDKAQLTIDFECNAAEGPQKLSKWDDRVSLSYTKELTGRAISTNHKYRKLQNVAKYKSKKSVYSDFDRPGRWEMISAKLDVLMGRAFQHHDKLYLIECSERTRLPFSESGIGFGKNKRFSKREKYLYKLAQAA